MQISTVRAAMSCMPYMSCVSSVSCVVRTLTFPPPPLAASDARMSHVMRDGLMLQTKNAFSVLEGTGTVSPTLGVQVSRSGSSSSSCHAWHARRPAAHTHPPLPPPSLQRFSYGEIDFWVESLRKMIYAHIRDELKFMDASLPKILQRLQVDMRLSAASCEAIAKVLR